MSISPSNLTVSQDSLTDTPRGISRSNQGDNDHESLQLEIKAEGLRDNVFLLF